MSKSKSGKKAAAAKAAKAAKKADESRVAAAQSESAKTADAVKESGRAESVQSRDFSESANASSESQKSSAPKTANESRAENESESGNESRSENESESERESQTAGEPRTARTENESATKSESRAADESRTENESESERESRTADSAGGDPLLKLGADELRDLYIRALAEKENTSKRAAAEIKKAHDFALARFAPGVCEVCDCLESALAELQKTDGDSKKDSGVLLTLRKLTAVMEANGILPVRPDIGAMFDANLHQAAGVGEGENARTISKVMRCGYTLNGRLIRPAIVWLGELPADSKTDAAKGANDSSAADNS